MNLIPDTEHALVVRTDFSDQPTWKAVCEAIRKPVPFFNMIFQAYVDILDDPAYADLSEEQVLALLPEDYDHSFLMIVDRATITHGEHPVLVVDLFDQRGAAFRALPREIQGIENNLSIANMDFEDFSGAVDEDGIFRGFPRS